LVVGDYVTRSSGPRAGELGSWHYVVAAIGIPARWTAMKLIFVAFGLTWLVITLGFASRAAWSRRAMLIMAAATLWYAPVGTLFGLVQIAGLLRLPP
jgi:hypothetical protein